jgi:hypothetical protein
MKERKQLTACLVGMIDFAQIETKGATITFRVRQAPGSLQFVNPDSGDKLDQDLVELAAHRDS